MTAVKFKIRKGDTVTIRTGKDKGKTGEVLSVVKSESKVVIKGINMFKRHVKTTSTATGGIIDMEKPIHISNVSLLDPKDNTATKVGYKFLENGTKIRYAKKSGESFLK